MYSEKKLWTISQIKKCRPDSQTANASRVKSGNAKVRCIMKIYMEYSKTML